MPVLFDADYGIGLLPGSHAIVTPMGAATSARNFSRPTIALEKSDGKKMAYWGENNKFPQEVIDDVRKDPDLGTLLNKCAELMYGGGLTFGTVAANAKGEEYIQPLPANRAVKIKEWLRRSNINRYLYEAYKDLSWFYNVFPEIVLNRERSEIMQLCVQAAENCRWEVQNTEGIIKHCYINANFDTDPVKIEDQLTKKLPVIDPYYDAAAALREDKRGCNFIYPLSLPSPGSSYYQLADWNAIRVSGWLQVSQQIPKFKQALLTNQITLKYHIEISNMYWELKFPNFLKLSDTERTVIKTTEMQLISDTLSGAEATGKSFYSVFKSEFNLGKDMSLIKITPIDDKVKSGQFLEDGKDASLYKISAIGLHPALIGSMPNNTMSGSNIREAYNLHVLSCQFKQHLVLEPLYLVRDFNGWGNDIEFRMKNTFMNTLDAGKETTQTTQS